MGRFANVGEGKGKARLRALVKQAVSDQLRGVADFTEIPVLS